MSQNIKLIQSANNEEEYGILIDQEVGRGNFGKVYKAVNLKNTQQQLAVKVLPLKDNNKKNLIQRQLNVLRQLPQHPNLITVKPFKYFSENNLYLLMDYCESTLQEELMKMDQKRLSQDQIVDLFYQLIKGYKVLYDRKILHQDIKPQNILIKDGLFKLADFGLSVFYENHAFDNNREGALGYISPQKLFKKNYLGNPKSDIYSLGIVMFEVIMGRHPYLSADAWKPGQSTEQIIQQLKDSKMKIQQSILNQYSLGFNELFDKVVQMIEKNEAKRISFDHLWQFVKRSHLFSNCKKSTKPSSPVMEQTKLLAHSNWIVKQVSQVLIVPMNALDSQEEQIVKQHKESKSLKLKTQSQESIEKLANYIIQKRVIVYFLDRIARRLVVRKMKEVNTPVQSKAILHLILFSKSLLSEVMSEIQAPKRFTFCEWKAFSNSESKKLIDLVVKDSRHLQDTINDTILEDKLMSKSQLKNANLLYRTGSREKQIEFLKNILMDTVRQISSLIDSSSSSAIITLFLLLKADKVLQNLSLSAGQIEELQKYNRSLDDKPLEELIQGIMLECEKREIPLSFDFSD